jgi:hypothetical protein
LQADLEHAVDYRKEYYKYAISIATALLAFTVSFPPQLSKAPDATWLLFLGWAGLGVAVLSGVCVHRVWAELFIGFRDHDNRGRREDGLKVRKSLNSERRFLDVARMVGLAADVVCVVIFAEANLKSLAPKTDSARVEKPTRP